MIVLDIECITFPVAPDHGRRLINCNVKGIITSGIESELIYINSLENYNTPFCNGRLPVGYDLLR